MPRASFQQLPEARREEILAAAAQEFATHGFQRTSYNQLLLRLGIGKSSAYHYFEDKADLFRTAVAENYAKWFRGLSALTPPKEREGFWPYIFELNLNGFRFMLEDPTSAALIQCAVREATNLEQVLGAEQVLAAVDQYHREILAMGQQLGAVRTDLPLERLSLLSRAIGAAEDQAFVQEVGREGREAVAARLPAFAEQLTDMLRRVLEVGIK
ncbi:MAG: TetR/AcrR family transcriptional regulator [Pseudomonadota bacterium]